MPVSAGTRLGPYEVAELRGAGGMGAVYRARDPRLGRDVAIKVLPDDIATDPDRLRRFELEAKAVAALNHPHILTVHDVGTHEGTPYVVTELLEGETLREVLTRRSPTQRQVLGWAVQIAQGLAAAHRKGIVHRDLKPENLFLTTEGRMKILDFGLAKLTAVGVDSEEMTASSPTKPGMLMGTVAYMSPEQVQARPVDARSDLFSFGVVLYEMLARKHPFRRETVAATLTAILQETPPELTSVDRGIPPAVDGIVRRCLDKRREERFQGAHDLSLALEAVLAAPTGAALLQEVEERSPYPGLSSFTEKDSALFFGREAEVKALWERIRSRRLLAVIGPSGVGKTSFLRAGVIPARPEGWAAVHTTPGSNPALGLARALTPDLAGDAEAMADLLSGVAELAQSGREDRVVSALRRWRQRQADALLVVDQFEELFTLNPPETQRRLAALLTRIANDADVHVVLSLRDDFLIRCSEQAPLAPVFESLTPLIALSPEGLRRAVAEPARKRGYRFDDDTLVPEMVSLVEGVRGALPLLAFAVARLWERRDRERKLLTREAYQEIAGVEGALAQHAEATMDRIGSERHAVVREIFRNLVTAQGTRAAIDREELLSAFPDRPAAEEALGQLIDARLLTSYEVEGKEGEPSHHRVEVVHESLLKAWPRLVRWQAQDEEGALLRDQLKQAAHLWEEKGRTADLLWTGTAFREYQLWRERYPGALTAIEEDFARSMGQRARRTQRLRWAAVAAVIAGLAVVAAAIGVSRQKAVAAALRSEASRLLALGQLRLTDDPTEALAFATASIELADSPEARLFAVKALGEGPPAMELAGGGACLRVPAFSPDSRQLAATGHDAFWRVWREDGSGPVILPSDESSSQGSHDAEWVASDRLVTGLCCGLATRAHVWSMPEGKPEGVLDFGSPSFWQVADSQVVTETLPGGTPEGAGEVRLRSWPLPGGPATELGHLDWRALGASRSTFAPDGESWLYAKGSTLFARGLGLTRGAADRVVGRHGAEITGLWTEASRPGRPGAVWTRDGSGALRRWALAAVAEAGVQTVPTPTTATRPVAPEWSGRWLIDTRKEEMRVEVWRRGAWLAARPLELRRSGSWFAAAWATHLSGDWLVASTASHTNLTFWPLRKPYPTVVDGYSSWNRPIAFSPEGRWLASSWAGNSLRLWPLSPDNPNAVKPQPPPIPPSYWSAFAFDPKGRFLFAVGNQDQAWVVPLDGAPAKRLAGFSKDTGLAAAAVSPSGRYAATAFGSGRGEKTLRVWDTNTWEMRTFELPGSSRPSSPPGQLHEQSANPWEGGIGSLTFVDETTLYSGGDGGVRRWDLTKGTQELVIAAPPGRRTIVRIRRDKGVAVTVDSPLNNAEGCSQIVYNDLATRSSRALPAFGNCVSDFELDASGAVLVTGDKDGIVRVGRLAGEEPHLLVGHKGYIFGVAISQDLGRIASTGEDNTLRLWPMPDLDKPPLHTLPHGELMAKLKSLTNLRAVRDPKTGTDWKIELGPFPGWKDVPSW